MTLDRIEWRQMISVINSLIFQQDLLIYIKLLTWKMNDRGCS